MTGRARFGADECVADLLWCAFARSPVPHARILNIDTTRAQAVEGVRVLMTGRDLPPRRWGRRLQDVPVLAIDCVRFIGEKVVAIAAETREAADQAARLVEVEYEELPAVFDPEAAMRGEVLLHQADANYEDAPPSLLWRNARGGLSSTLPRTPRIWLPPIRATPASSASKAA